MGRSKKRVNLNPPPPSARRGHQKTGVDHFGQLGFLSRVLLFCSPEFGSVGCDIFCARFSSSGGSFFYHDGTHFFFDFIQLKPADTWPRDRCGRAKLVLLPSLVDFLHLGADL